MIVIRKRPWSLRPKTNKDFKQLPRSIHCCLTCSLKLQLFLSLCRDQQMAIEVMKIMVFVWRIINFTKYRCLQREVIQFGFVFCLQSPSSSVRNLLKHLQRREKMSIWDVGNDNNATLYIYIFFFCSEQGEDWSCPVLVSDPFQKKGISYVYLSICK